MFHLPHSTSFTACNIIARDYRIAFLSHSDSPKRVSARGREGPQKSLGKFVDFGGVIESVQVIHE
jgi:hypothetical protein